MGSAKSLKKALPILLFSFLYLFSSVTGLDLSLEYEFGPIPFADGVEFYFTIDRNSSEAALAVKLTDTDLVQSLDASNWLGLGVSEATSGSMLGSDVVTAEFGDGDTDECKFTDRYVPFYAFPLIESRPNSPAAFPLPDDCQNDTSWELVRCERDADTGEMVLEVTRGLDAHDTQDREIGPGFQNMIYAAGSEFRYHQARRSSIRLVMYQADGGTDLVGQGEPDLPDDIDEDVEIVATNFTLPSEFTTSYACTSKRISLEEGEKKMIVATEPIVTSSLVHHLTLFLCRGEEFADRTKETTLCGSGLSDVDSPLGGNAGCVTFIGGYAKGAGRNVVPRNAGILVDEGEYILVMETHYDNPQQRGDVVDGSGMRVFLTNTLREDEAGTLMIGDPLVALAPEAVQSREYEFSCPPECTAKLPKAINVYSSLLHMHTTGMEIYTNKLTPQGKFVEHFNKINFWSDSFQVLSFFDPPRKINPGDHMQMVCKFDVSKRPNTTFGGTTANEMCMDFLGYWPVQRDPETGERLNICAFIKTGETSMTNATVCGDIATNITESILPIPNPKLEDTFGAPTDFGNEVETCPMSAMPSPDMSTPNTPISGGGSENPETAMPSPDVSTPNTPISGGGSENPETAPGEGLEESVVPSDDDDPDPETTPDDEDNVCFPGSATVTLQDGTMKQMSALAIGDVVQVGTNEYSEVFMFTHRSAGIGYKFVELGIESGESLSLTHGHYLYVNGALQKAGEAVPGDLVRLGDGSIRRIVRKRSQMGRGLFNPQTLHGDIVVDGVVASTYTQSVDAPLAHGLLAPLRWLYHACGVDSSPIVVGA